MNSIQVSKQQLQTLVDQSNSKSLFAISINNPAQKQEVSKVLDAAIREKRQVTVCVIKQ